MPITATHALGIDFHKARSTFVLLDNESTPIWKRDVPSTPKDFRHALGLLRGVVPLDRLPAAIEPVCGWRWAVDLLMSEGVDIKVANPRKVRMIADSLDKTDANDAAILAWIRMVDKLPTSYVAPEATVDLRRLVRTYLFLVRQRTTLKNRIQALGTEEGLNVTLGNTATTKGLTLLEERRGDNPSYRALIDGLRAVEKVIRPLHARMAELAKTDPVIHRLTTMPQVGPVTATTVVAEVGDFTRFRFPKEVVGYAGLAPKQRSSGERVRMGAITKAGSDTLRHIIVEAATRVRKEGDGALSVYYAAYAADHPQAKPKAVRVALARVMLVAMHRMIVTGSDFDPGRFVRGKSEVTSSAG